MTGQPATQTDGLAQRLSRIATATLARSRGNFTTTFAKIGHRLARRPAPGTRLPWLRWIFMCVLLLVLAALVFDAPVGAYFGQWPSGLVALAEVATKAGLSGWYLVPAALAGVAMNLADWSRWRGRSLLLAYNRTGLALFVLISVGLSGILANIIKQAVGRARPGNFADGGVFRFEPLTGMADFASFPSGHSCTAGAVGMALALLWPGARLVVIPLALALAMTRIVLGAHYPSDVIAGLALGASFTLLVAMLFARLGYVFRMSPGGMPARRPTFRLF